MKYPQGRLLQFARYPVLGRVKTRLAPALAPEVILELHWRLVAHTNGVLQRSQLAEVALWYSSEGGVAEGDPFVAGLWWASSHRQQGADLGERMHNAFAATLGPQGGCEFAVLVGSDCPFLHRDILHQALAALADGVDAVIGPAADGGYYLIGLRRPREALFTDIPWGGGDVCAITLARLSRLGLSCSLLETLADVDVPADLALLEEFPHLRVR